MRIPWLTRPPTAEEVAAHAKAYPVGPPELDRGLWLRLPEQPAAWKRAGDLRELYVIGDRHIGGDWCQGDTATACWLPCTAEGVPVCLLPTMAAFADWAASVEKALEHLTEALEASVDWEDEIPRTRAEIRKARNLLAALERQR